MWRSCCRGDFYSAASVDAGRVYVGSLDGHVYAFSARTGEQLWSFVTAGYVYASPAVWRGLVLVGSYDHRFYALDAATGDVRWRFESNGPISGSATVLDGVVCALKMVEALVGGGLKTSKIGGYAAARSK